MNMNSILNYIRDYDVQRWLLFALKHPRKAKGMGAVQGIPPYLDRKLHESADCIQSPYEGKIRLLGTGQKYQRNSAPAICVRQIWLAGKSIPLDYCAIHWDMIFEDDEDTAAYHRFIWMYNDFILQLENGVSMDGLHELAVNTIKGWIRQYGTKDSEGIHPEVYQTYSVSERVVNWLYALSITSNKETFQDREIHSSICRQVKYICRHLEYYGEQFTGNHLSNNGKAIYIAGVMLGIEKYQQIGREILLNERKRILVNGGFLREGSAHYQFLITKNYVDVYWAAVTLGDGELADEIKETIEELSGACRYFLVKTADGTNTIPYIGDLSPDYPPSWIIKVPEVAAYLLDNIRISKGSPGYHSPFAEENTSFEAECNPPVCSPKLGDWGKLESEHWMVFTHVNHSLFPNNLTGHFHHDTGALVVYHNGNCLITDCGRNTYRSTARGRRDKCIRAHSGIEIDGKEPEIDMRTIYSDEFLKEYLKKKPEVNILSPEEMKVEINGYTRCKHITGVSRNIQIKQREIRITDYLEGTGIHEVQLFFHVPDKVKKEPYRCMLGTMYSISCNSERMKYNVIDGNQWEADGHGAAAYGDDYTLNTIVISGRISFPQTIVTRICLEEL